MDKARLVLRWLLIPLWFTIFIAYLPIWLSANELVLFQLSGLLGCFSDIVGQGHAVHEVEDTPMNPRKAAV